MRDVLPGPPLEKGGAPVPEEQFAHLHVASGFSLLHGASPPQMLAARAGELGMTTLALTDRDSLAGAVRFTMACRTAGVRPVFGAELAIEELFPAEVPYRGGCLGEHGGRCRVTFLARDMTGWSALCRMISAVHAADREQPFLSRQVLAAHTGRGGVLVLLGPDSDVGARSSTGTPRGRLRGCAPGRRRSARTRSGWRSSAICLPVRGRGRLSWPGGCWPSPPSSASCRC
ncbi:PHP domain-containing protein (plasmid) [Streptosporangium sp. CA-135522]|uniref:PHP domain-containing protein n=1 Tax=Streptosporangium sp. CA-135522 TaxID=3240072 RepID=UPI003D9460FA